MKALRVLPVMVLAVAGILSITATAGAVPFGGRFSPTYRCTGGNIRPGTYDSILVTGVCYMPAGNITITGDLTVNAGALLDAVTPGDPVASANPLLPAEVSIGGNVFVGAGGVLLLGCSPFISCPRRRSPMTPSAGA
jgi:acetyltransferase-like isoleucine patch superfamily enzyme